MGYPNPASAFIKLELPEDSPANLTCQIINTLGQIIRPEEMLSTSRQVDIHNLPAGLYYLRIRAGKEQIIRSFVKS